MNASLFTTIDRPRAFLAIVACAVACANPPDRDRSVYRSSGEALTSSLTIANSVIAGQSTPLVLAAYYDNAALKNTTVQFSASGTYASSDKWGGSTTGATFSVSTGSSGSIHTTFSCSGAGGQTITASYTDPSGNVVSLPSKTVNVTHATITKPPSSLSASPSVATAGSATLLTEILTDTYGNPLGGQTVTFKASPSGGTFTDPTSGATQNTEVTNGSGQAQINFTADVEGTTTITASGGLSLTLPLQVTGTSPDPNHSTLTAPKGTWVANGTAHLVLTLTARDEYGNALSGVSVTFQSTASADTFGTPAGTTGKNGVLTTTVSTTLAGERSFSALLNDTVTVTMANETTFNPGPTSSPPSTLTANPELATAGSPALLTVLVKDVNNNDITSQKVTFSANEPGTFTNPTTGATQTSTTTDGSGQAQINFTPTKEGTTTVTASAGGAIKLQIPVQGNSPITAKSKLTAPSGNFVADGNPHVTLTLTAEDTYGNLLSGVSVAFQSSVDSDTFGGSPTMTGAGGVVTTSLSATVAGPHTIQAVLNGTTTVTIAKAINFVAGAPASGSVIIAPSTIALKGTTTFQVQYVDAYGNDTPSQKVTFSAPTGSGITFSPATQSTNTSGEAQTTVKGTVEGTQSITATCNGVQVGSSVVVTGPPPKPSLVPSASSYPDCGTTVNPCGNETGTIAPVTLLFTSRNLEGDTVPSETVTLTAVSSIFSPSGPLNYLNPTLCDITQANCASYGNELTLTTGPDGTVQMLLTGGAPSTVTVTATAGTPAASTTATVEVTSSAISVETSAPPANGGNSGIWSAADWLPVGVADPIYVGIVDMAGYTAGGVPITLSVSPSGATVSPLKGNTASITSAVANQSAANAFRNENGFLTGSLTATEAGTYYVSATSGSTSLGTLTIHFVATAPSSSTSTLALSATSIPAEGTAQSIATVTVEDSSGHPIPNQTVMISQTIETGGETSFSEPSTDSSLWWSSWFNCTTTFSGSCGLTDSNGVLTFILRSTVPNARSISVTVSPGVLGSEQWGAGALPWNDAVVALSEKAFTLSKTLTSIEPAPAHVTLTVAPTDVLADNASVATLTVNVFDQADVPLGESCTTAHGMTSCPQITVTFTSLSTVFSGGTTSCLTSSADSVPDESNAGICSVNTLSSTLPFSTTVTATATTPFGSAHTTETVTFIDATLGNNESNVGGTSLSGPGLLPAPQGCCDANWGGYAITVRCTLDGVCAVAPLPQGVEVINDGVTQMFSLQLVDDSGVALTQRPVALGSPATTNPSGQADSATTIALTSTTTDNNGLFNGTVTASTGESNPLVYGHFVATLWDSTTVPFEIPIVVSAPATAAATGSFHLISDYTVSTLTATPTTPNATAVVANASQTFTLTLNAIDINGVPISNAPVTFSGNLGDIFTPATGFTNSEGVYQATVASTSAGSDSVVAILGGNDPVDPFAVSQTIGLTPPSPTMCSNQQQSWTSPTVGGVEFAMYLTEYYDISGCQVCMCDDGTCGNTGGSCGDGSNCLTQPVTCALNFTQDSLSGSTVTATPASSIPAWTGSTSYTPGELVDVTDTNGDVWTLVCTESGQSSGSAPAWPVAGGWGGAPVGGACSQIFDCADGNTCLNGTCSEPPTQPACPVANTNCTASDDCCSGQICVDAVGQETSNGGVCSNPIAWCIDEGNSCNTLGWGDNCCGGLSCQQNVCAPAPAHFTEGSPAVTWSLIGPGTPAAGALAQVPIGAWAAGAAYQVGDYVTITDGAGNAQTLVCASAGTSSLEAPTWPSSWSAGTAVSEGGVVWEWAAPTSSGAVPADGESAYVLVVNLMDANGTPLQGEAVNASSAQTGDAFAGTLIPLSHDGAPASPQANNFVDMGNGVYVAALSSFTAGADTSVSITVDGSPLPVAVPSITFFNVSVRFLCGMPYGYGGYEVAGLPTPGLNQADYGQPFLGGLAGLNGRETCGGFIDTTVFCQTCPKGAYPLVISVTDGAGNPQAGVAVTITGLNGSETDNSFNPIADTNGVISGVTDSNGNFGFQEYDSAHAVETVKAYVNGSNVPVVVNGSTYVEILAQ